MAVSLPFPNRGRRTAIGRLVQGKAGGASGQIVRLLVRIPTPPELSDQSLLEKLVAFYGKKGIWHGITPEAVGCWRISFVRGGCLLTRSTLGFSAMSKTQILEELPRLSRSDRREVFDRLYEVEETDLLRSSELDDSEKALLDRELEAYAQTPNDGAPWPDVAARLRQ